MKKISASLTVIGFIFSLLNLMSATNEVRAHSGKISEGSTMEASQSTEVHITVPKCVAMVLGQEDNHIRGNLKTGQAFTSVILCGTPGAKVRVTVKAHEGALLNEHDGDEEGVEYALKIGKTGLGGRRLRKEGMSTYMTIPESGRLPTEMRVEWDDDFKQPFPGVYQDTLTVEVALEN